MRLVVLLNALFMVLSLSAQAKEYIVDTEAKLNAAAQKAEKDDIILLSADIDATTPKSLKAGVTMKGNSDSRPYRRLNHIPKPESAINDRILLKVDGQAGVRLEHLELTAADHTNWSIQAMNGGDLTLSECTVNVRALAKTGGTLKMRRCNSNLLFPRNEGNKSYEFLSHYGAYGKNAVFDAKDCLFVLGWTDRKVDTSLFMNYGGNDRTKLLLDHCTVVAAKDADPGHGGGPGRDNRHIAMIRSDNVAGDDYKTVITNSIFIGDASSVFSYRGTGDFTSRFNCNAGMLRNPAAYAHVCPESGQAIGPPNFYYYSCDEDSVEKHSKDICEFNPFVDAMTGNYRLMPGSKSATAGEDGSALGAPPEVLGSPPAARRNNLYNGSFREYDDGIGDRAQQSYVPEKAFYGWRWLPRHKEGCEQYYVANDGINKLRLEARNTRKHTGGNNNSETILHGVYQTFSVEPGEAYSIQAAVQGGLLKQKGKLKRTYWGRIVVCNGAQTALCASPLLDVRSEKPQAPIGGDFITPNNSSQVTVFLIHETNDAYNYTEWDDVTVTP